MSEGIASAGVAMARLLTNGWRGARGLVNDVIKVVLFVNGSAASYCAWFCTFSGIVVGGEGIQTWVLMRWGSQDCMMCRWITRCGPLRPWCLILGDSVRETLRGRLGVEKRLERFSAFAGYLSSE